VLFFDFQVMMTTNTPQMPYQICQLMTTLMMMTVHYLTICRRCRSLADSLFVSRPPKSRIYFSLRIRFYYWATLYLRPMKRPDRCQQTCTCYWQDSSQTQKLPSVRKIENARILGGGKW